MANELGTSAGNQDSSALGDATGECVRAESDLVGWPLSLSLTFNCFAQTNADKTAD